VSTHTYEVWAPEADSLSVLVGAGEPTAYAMERSDDGWWRVAAERGDGRYAFSVDGGEPRPDPRSLSQPDGVHAASELVDTAAFVWTDGGWAGVPMPEAVVYEMHVGTFTPGRTFDSAVQRLDHLVDLGVTVVEVMPVAAFPGDHGWGYDGVSLYAVHAAYGGPQAFARFVDACHARGLAVWLDVVYNHFGPSGNYLATFGPYFTDKHHTPWGKAVNLDDAGSDEVRRYVLDNARMWLADFHLDGLRLDAVHELHDHRAVPLLEELAAMADGVAAETGVPRHLVAESDRNDPTTVAPRGPGGTGGLGLHGQWVDDVHHALHGALTGEAQGYYADFAAPEALPKVLATTPFFHDGTYSSFRGRTHGAVVHPDITPGWRFVASLQTHDQVGNRAVGERLCHLTTPGLAAVGAALLLTSPYTPMLFMGEEWAAGTPWQFFTSHEEEWLAESVREGRAREFAEHGWSDAVPDPQALSTVEASTLDWSEPSRPGHARMLQWYRTLLRLRRELPALRDTPLGQGWVERDEESGVLLVGRGGLTVVGNLAAEPRTVRLSERVAGRQVLAAWGQAQVSADEVALDPHDVVVLGT
jgi:maltooligosyltrehalose trehalohydrolase